MNRRQRIWERWARLLRALPYWPSFSIPANSLYQLSRRCFTRGETLRNIRLAMNSSGPFGTPRRGFPTSCLEKGCKLFRKSRNQKIKRITQNLQDRSSLASNGFWWRGIREPEVKRFKSNSACSAADEYSCPYIITFLSHCLANPPDSFIVAGKDSNNSWKRSNGVTIIIMRINTLGLQKTGKGVEVHFMETNAE